MRPLHRRLVLVLALCAAACADPDALEATQDPVAASNWEAPPSAAGAESCRDCHGSIVESWSRTGMARSVSAIDPIEFRGVEPVEDVPSGYVYHFETDDAGVRVVETRPNAPAHRVEAEVAYAIGADDIRSYVALHGAFEVFAPIEIVNATAESERHSALAPGHMAVPNQRFSVPITPECLGCHTENLPPPTFPLHLHQADAWTPRGISCVACHDPVERHATWQRADLTGKSPAGPDPIAHIAQLSREQRMSICAACHLQGDVRIPLDSQVGPPTPGGDILDRLVVFVPARTSQDIGFVSHTQRLVESTCYQKSKTMWCGSCHDPHRPLRGDEQQRVRNACLECHRSDGEASVHACSRPESMTTGDRDCVSCHMRETPVFDVAHVEIHDHFIRRDPGPPSAPMPIRNQASPNGDWKVFGWPGLPAPATADDPGLWMFAYTFRGHHERALAKALEAPGPRAQRFPMYHHARGGLLEGIGKLDAAIASYQQALQLDPGLTAAAINLGMLRGLSGDLEGGIEILDRVLERYPAAVNALRNRAGLRIQKGDATGFVADLTRAFELGPDAVVADILAEWHRENGDARAAADWSRKAAALDPVEFK